MSRNPVRRRKSPYHHTVRAHTRSGTPVRSFTRGTGEPVPIPSPGRRSRVVGGKIVTHDVLTGITSIRPMKPGKPRGEPPRRGPYRGVELPPKPLPEFPPVTRKRPPEFPPEYIRIPEGPIPEPGPYLPMPVLVGGLPSTDMTPHEILGRSNQLLALYKQGQLVWQKIGIAKELKALSDEHRRLTGVPTTMGNIHLEDLFTKKQLEEYNRRLRRKKK